MYLWARDPAWIHDLEATGEFLRRLNTRLTGQTEAMKSPVPMTGNWLENIHEPIRLDNRARADSIPVLRAENPFYTMPRKDELHFYPCSSCHEKIKRSMFRENPHFELLGWEFEHGGGGMFCTTCHHPERPNRLRLRNWEPVSFDRSYQICRHCHFKQVKNWKGGAHSKQISSWRKPRIRYTCTNCHNPHSPRFKKRWPLGFPHEKEDH